MSGRHVASHTGVDKGIVGDKEEIFLWGAAYVTTVCIS